MIPAKLEVFAEKLVARFKKESTFINTADEAKKNETTWDAAIRMRTRPIIKDVYLEIFDESPVERVYFEGEGRGLSERGVSMSKLFGSSVFPDALILKPFKTAIEFDHSKSKGKPGASFKMALAKAAFNYLSHNWDYCLLLFYNGTGQELSLEGETEKEILRKYLNEFNTKCYVI